MNLIGGENKCPGSNLVEVNDLEITDTADFFHKNKNIKKLLQNSLIKTNSSLERNSQPSVSNLEETKTDTLEIIDLNIDNPSDLIKLRKPNEVYYEIYKAAREKAKRAKKLATEAYLEAKNIKIKYMLDDLDESEEDEVYSENN